MISFSTPYLIVELGPEVVFGLGVVAMIVVAVAVVWIFTPKV